jgi:HD-GYP domain-containing protein (c-di-GMP phosphodiesterase class II)
MTSRRAYRPALTIEQALGELTRCAGSQFDPELAAAFVEGWVSGEIETSERPLRLAI